MIRTEVTLKRLPGITRGDERGRDAWGSITRDHMIHVYLIFAHLVAAMASSPSNRSSRHYQHPRTQQEQDECAGRRRHAFQ